jgi:hypothetical protein
MASGFWNLADYSAPTDGVHNASQAIQHAINDAYAGGGGIVFFPPGTYGVFGTVIVPSGVTLQGSGWESTWSDAQTAKGTWIRPIDSTHNLFYVLGATGVTIRDLAFCFSQGDPNQPDWAPIPYEHAISVENSGTIYLHNINLFNATRGLIVANCGAVSIDRVVGSPILIGIEIIKSHDTCKLRDVHFWRWFEEMYVDDHGYWLPGHDNIVTYKGSNGSALRIERADNHMYSDVFAIGYSIGVEFAGYIREYIGPHGEPETSAEIANKVRLVNVDTDNCGVGIRVQGENATLMIVNFTHQGGDNGLAIVDDGIKVQAENVRIDRVQNESILVEGNSKLFISHLWVKDWNLVGAPWTFHAIEAWYGGEIFLGRPAFFQGAHTRREGDGGRVLTNFDDLAPGFD